MKLPKEAIEEFKKLYESDVNESLSFKKAEEKAISLM